MLVLKEGICAGVVAIVTLVLDAISLFIECGILNYILESSTFICWVFSKKSDECIMKIRNEEYMRRVIESATISAIFTFVIERIFMPLA